jgi:hypothetical protein
MEACSRDIQPDILSVAGADAAQIEFELNAPVALSVVAYQPVLGDP